jgi:hypothetical protein
MRLAAPRLLPLGWACLLAAPVHAQVVAAPAPFREGAPISFRPARARAMAPRQTQADSLVYAPNGRDFATYGGAAATLHVGAQVTRFAEQTNVLDTFFSADGARVAFVGATSGFVVRDTASGATVYDPRQYVDGGAFAEGDSARVLMFKTPNPPVELDNRPLMPTDTEQGVLFEADAPFAEAPRPLTREYLKGYEVHFVDEGRRVILYDDRDDGSLTEVTVADGRARTIARQIDGSIVVARGGSRVCYRERSQRPVSEPRAVVCVRLRDLRVEHVVVGASSYGEPLVLSEDGERLFLRYSKADRQGVFADRYAIAEMSQQRLFPLVGVRGYIGGVLTMNLAGTAVAAGSSAGIHVFHLGRRERYVIRGQETYGVAAVVGKPESLAVRKEVPAGQDLYELAAP